MSKMLWDHNKNTEERHLSQTGNAPIQKTPLRGGDAELSTCRDKGQEEEKVFWAKGIAGEKPGNLWKRLSEHGQNIFLGPFCHTFDRAPRT